MTTLARVSLFMLVLTVLVMAQSVAGAWQGATGNGVPLTLELKVDGEILTGTLTRANESTAITDGTVVNNKFRFEATLGGRTEGFAGELTGELLVAYLERAGPEASIAFKRAK